jgi:glycolate oxidase FAD binding subunit
MEPGYEAMSPAVPDLPDLTPAPPDITALLPPAPYVFAPPTIEGVAGVLEAASGRRAPVLVWGGGLHQGIGNAVAPQVVLSTTRLDRIIAWEPEDLTVVVEAGARIGRLEERLEERGQTALLPEMAPDATIGGVIAAGLSGYRRARFGPTRDRVLQVTLVTGDGRVVVGGGRVVKNVSGYDLPRIATGSFGSLGLIASVCLKLWPLPEARATVAVGDADSAWRTAFRPMAVLETPAGSFAYLQGTNAEVASQVSRLGGSSVEGFKWPATPAGVVVVSIRVRPSLTSAVVKKLPPGATFVAQHGVGEVVAGLPAEAGTLFDLRGWAESEGGSLVLISCPDGFADTFDPWGALPAGLDLQRRLIAAFDPMRVVNPGRLPGGI